MKEIKITSNGIKKAIDDLVDENERLQDKVYKLEDIIKEVREMLEHKVEFHKNLDFYEDKDLETQAYYNYVACLQDFDEIVEKYKLESQV